MVDESGLLRRPSNWPAALHTLHDCLQLCRGVLSPGVSLSTRGRRRVHATMLPRQMREEDAALQPEDELTETLMELKVLLPPT